MLGKHRKKMIDTLTAGTTELTGRERERETERERDRERERGGGERWGLIVRTVAK